MNKQCVNCPGATDHTTAECPVMVEASAPIDPIHSAMMLGMTPEPCEPIIEITRQALTKLLDVVEFGDQLERVEKDRLVAFVKEILAEAQPELWAMHSVGPNEVHPMISKEEAEKQAASLIALCKDKFPEIPITVNVIPSPYSPFEHFEILAEELTEQVASLREALDKKNAEAAAPAVVNQQVTTAAVAPDALEQARRHLSNAIEDAEDGKNAAALPALREAAHFLAQAAASTVKDSLSVAASDVLAERQRQITAEGYDSGHDDMATRGQLAIAAGCYAMWSGHPALMGRFSWKAFFPWDWKYWKPSTPRHNLIRAGALILAEIERLDRAEQAKQQEQQP